MLTRSILRSTTALIVLLAVTMFSTLSVATAGKSVSPSTPVVVAEDVTKASECLRSVDGGPEFPCPEGSILSVRETTYGEVTTKGIKNWTFKTKNVKSDEHQVLNAAQVEYAPRLATTCTHSQRTITQSYLYAPNVSNSTRIGMELQYTRNSNCSVTNITDRNRVQTVGTNANAGFNPTNVYWINSCVGSTCQTRDFYFNTNWTYRLPLSNSSVGTKYVNKSRAQPECKINGVRCGDPYAYYFLD